VLEPSMVGTYVRYPYLGLHGYRALVTWLVPQWQSVINVMPVTYRAHVFPHGVILLDHMQGLLEAQCSSLLLFG
jgi:hypothetical protein